MSVDARYFLAYPRYTRVRKILVNPIQYRSNTNIANSIDSCNGTRFRIRGKNWRSIQQVLSSDRSLEPFTLA